MFDTYNPGYGNSYTGSMVWTIVSLVLAIIGGIAIYVIFNTDKFKFDNKFINWFKEFCNFDKLVIEVILKVTYIIFALFITLSSFALIGTSFLGFLGQLIFGNLFIRVIYEGSLILFNIFKNVREINKKMK